MVAGGSGFVGRHLTGLLCARSDRVTVLTRSPEHSRSAQAGVTFAPWIPDVSDFDAVVNLSGESIFGARWTPAVKERLRASRIDTTRRIVDACATAREKPRVLVNASAIGFYGDRGDEMLPESATRGGGFLADMCAEWEGEAQRASALGVRVVTLRIGVVLGRHGGALEQLVPIYRLGLGGPVLPRNGWFPWIHLNDLCRLILFAIEREDLRGALNAVGPSPVTQAELARTLGSVLHRPALFPVPRFALAVRFGELADSLTASLRVVPEAATRAGFVFEYPALRPALENLLLNGGR